MQRVSSSKEVGSLLDAGDETEFSVGIVACNYLSDLQRCVRSLLPLGEKHSLEVVIVDNGSTDGTSSWLEEQARREPRLRVIHTDHVLGDAAAKNILLKQSRGTYFVLMDTSVEAHDDFLAPLSEALADDSVGVVGPWGLRSEDMQHFNEVEDGDADANAGLLLRIPSVPGTGGEPDAGELPVLPESGIWSTASTSGIKDTASSLLAPCPWNGTSTGCGPAWPREEREKLSRGQLPAFPQEVGASPRAAAGIVTRLRPRRRSRPRSPRSLGDRAGEAERVQGIRFPKLPRPNLHHVPVEQPAEVARQ